MIIMERVMEKRLRSQVMNAMPFAVYPGRGRAVSGNNETENKKEIMLGRV